MKRLGLIGARGYVGGELVRLLAAHKGFELACVSSRQLKGERVCDHFEHPSTLVVEDLSPEMIEDRGDIDAWILALPNGLAATNHQAIRKANADAVVVDLSADYRFDSSWVYGLTERNRESIRTARDISNPGCYATAIQMAVTPLLGILQGPVHAFGVSGYSGAGTTPSDKNNPERLTDNLLPYSLTGHIHEREVTRHLEHTVHFMPHVASFFRGISMTISATVDEGLTAEKIWQRYEACWGEEPLVILQADGIPEVRANAGQHHVCVGGLSLDTTRNHVVVISTIDNLLKGAATQALQNANLACGFDELEGIR